jgi:hypothetical protein
MSPRKSKAVAGIENPAVNKRVKNSQREENSMLNSFEAVRGQTEGNSASGTAIWSAPRRG